MAGENCILPTAERARSLRRTPRRLSNPLSLTSKAFVGGRDGQRFRHLLKRNDWPRLMPVMATALAVNQPRFDITDRRDVACLVKVFYDRVRDDAVLGPIFDDIAHVDWATHLPRMCDFWESVLFAGRRSRARHWNSAARIAAILEYNIDSKISSVVAPSLRDRNELVAVVNHNRPETIE